MHTIIKCQFRGVGQGMKQT